MSTTGADQTQRRDMRVAAADGVRLWVCDLGPRSADHTIVFLHGFCLDHTSWVHQVDYLRRRYAHRIRVISYDHRGHGASDPAPTSTCRIEQLADDHARVLTALDVTGPATMVGHSMGAMVILAYLARSAVDRPVDPDGLVLVATAAGHLTQCGLGRLLAIPGAAVLLALAGHAPIPAIKRLARPGCAALGRWCGCGHSEQVTVSAVVAAALAGTPVSTALGFLPALRDFDQVRALGSIHARTVIVSGGMDLLTPAARAHELAAAIPGAAHVHVPAGGHMLPQQVPHVVNAAIRRVIALPERAGHTAGPRSGKLRPATRDYALAAGGGSAI
jgi:pimeloyl-ACP methyl ester carboxylesterase